MNSGTSPSPSGSRRFRIVFADGAAYRVQGLRPLESILQPIVLKFIILCVLLYILLQRRPHLASMDWWFEAMLWLSIMVTTVSWLVLSITIGRWLMERNIISLIYTPLISMPLILWNEAIGQILISAVSGQPVGPLSEIMPFVMRDILVILLLDIQFGSFVAPLHPLFRRVDLAADDTHPLPPALPQAPSPIMAESRPQAVSAAVPNAAAFIVGSVDSPDQLSPPQENASSPATPPPETPPSSSPLPSSIELDGRLVMLSDIMLVTAEDHYVRVQTVDRQFLIRGKFSSFTGNLGEGLGIQASRSAWIGAAFIGTAHRTPDYRIILTTSDRQEIEVARSRRSEVLDFLRRCGIEVSRSGPPAMPAAG